MWKFIKLTKSIITVMMTGSVVCLTIETGNNEPFSVTPSTCG